mgnify:CR=1 FL=1
MPKYVGYDSVMPAKAGIQYDSRPPMTSGRGLDPCLRRGDIVTSTLKIAFRAEFVHGSAFAEVTSSLLMIAVLTS